MNINRLSHEAEEYAKDAEVEHEACIHCDQASARVTTLIIRAMNGEELTDSERVTVQHEHRLAGIRVPHSRIRTAYGRRVQWTYDAQGNMRPTRKQEEEDRQLAALHTALGYDDLLF